MGNLASAPYKPSKEDVAREQRWQAESDLRTLVDAAKIKKDPARLKRAKAFAAEQAKAANAAVDNLTKA